MNCKIVRGINPDGRVPRAACFRNKGFNSIKARALQSELFPVIHATCVSECRIKSKDEALEIYDIF